MKTILIVDKVSLQIQSRYQDVGANQGRYGGPWGDPNQTTHLELPAGLDVDCVKAEEVDGQVTISQDNAKAAAKLLVTREQKLNDLRKLRNDKLSRADQLINIAFLNSWTAAEKTELKDFRQSLLDITEPFKADMSTLDGLDLNNVSWPVEPSEA